MAIVILGETLCPLCGCVISDGEGTVTVPHFIESPSHPLWQYSDTAMHYKCFQVWQNRNDFVAEYNNTIGRIVWGNGSQHQMQPDGVIVTTMASDGNLPIA